MAFSWTGIELDCVLVILVHYIVYGRVGAGRDI
jgi:hypothetical protein